MSSPSLATRAVIAVSLMVGFYVLAIGIAAALVYIPYAEWAYAGRLHVKLALGCLLGAGAILWAIAPRRDSFPAPGPRLTSDANPDLFRVLQSIAGRTKQAMPSEVYLVPQVNAWVANRGGVMGFGGRRVMGIGLPLLQVVKIAELEAIIAHEFGHYFGGDTRLGPWIYKTRHAIGRTLSSLGEEGWLHLPFRWYGSRFLRITQSISRAQELAADRLAATVVGANALIEGLKKVHGAAGAFESYWEQEALPVLNAGFHVPLCEGFGVFLSAPRVKSGIQSTLEEELRTERQDPYDSHPPLRERIAAVESSVAGSAPECGDPASALQLLGDVATTEKSLLAYLAKDGEAAEFQPLAWSDVTEKLLLPRWRAQAQRLAPCLAGVTLANLPDLVVTRGQEIASAVSGEQVEVPVDRLPHLLAGPIGACLIATLVDAGWTLNADVGEPVRLFKAGTELQPFAVIAQLNHGDTGRSSWVKLLESHGLTGRPLA